MRGCLHDMYIVLLGMFASLALDTVENGVGAGLCSWAWMLCVMVHLISYSPFDAIDLGVCHV